METNNMKIVKIEISKDALDTIKEIQSKDGYNVRERQSCMMEAISDLTLSPSCRRCRQKQILPHTYTPVGL